MDAAELASIYEDLKGKLYALALAITRREDLAEETLQQVFCALASPGVAPRDGRAYVLRAVRNEALGQLGRARRAGQPLDGEGILEAIPAPDSQSEAGVLDKRRVWAALEKLKADERETIVLYVWGGFSLQEIADLRRRSVNTVGSWYRRGLARLRVWLSR